MIMGLVFLITQRYKEPDEEDPNAVPRSYSLSPRKREEQSLSPARANGHDQSKKQISPAPSPRSIPMANIDTRAKTPERPVLKIQESFISPLQLSLKVLFPCLFIFSLFNYISSLRMTLTSFIEARADD